MDRTWDAIVVGTGMGGAVIGFSLARAGKKVLFCEMGKSHLGIRDSLKGDYAEEFLSQSEAADLPGEEVLARTGRYRARIEDASSRRPFSFVPFIGSGTGGSSALYGMVMERFHPADFEPGRYHRQATGSSIPEQWPISYAEISPFYESAEKLFRVRGTPDPLRDDASMGNLLAPPPLSPGVEAIHDSLTGKNLHPYRPPVACEFVSGCTYCQSYLCEKSCKNDSARICLEPAISRFGATLASECEVERLEATRSKVTGVFCRQNGDQLTLKGDIVVLAAGALETPRILLNSSTPEWPNGLANDSGLVGRNLMRHYIDLYAVASKIHGKSMSSIKEIAFNDFYLHDSQKLGSVQSFGAMPPASMLADGLVDDLRKGPLSLLAGPLALAKPLVKTVLHRIFRGRIVLASILEDLPYAGNRITLPDSAGRSDEKRLVLHYQISDYDRLRIEEFRREVAKALRPHSFMLIKQADSNERIAHACGTCRFGSDPKESVLDPQNRAHGISNLFVVDSSFFPTSGGTNPGLTIAANALRVSDHLLN
ncbi:GMC family oxidoreductase [Candidatus Moduliflexota bacterium]